MRDYLKSHKLANVCYDIRGPVHERATVMEEEGHRILKLKIGNPTPFGFDAPEATSPPLPSPPPSASSSHACTHSGAS